MSAAIGPSLHTVALLQQPAGETVVPKDRRQLSLPLLLSVPPSLDRNSDRSEPEMSYPSKPKTFQERQAGELLVDRMDEMQVAAWFADQVEAIYGDFKSTDKRVANDAGASMKTAQNWRTRKNTPSLPNFLRVVARRPELFSALVELIASKAEPEPARVVNGSTS